MFISDTKRRSASAKTRTPEPLPPGNMIGFYFMNHLRRGLMGDLSSYLKTEDVAQIRVGHDPSTGNAVIFAIKKNGDKVCFCYDAFDRKFYTGLSPTAYNASTSFYQDASTCIDRLEKQQAKMGLNEIEKRDLAIHRERLTRAAVPLTFYDTFV